MSTKAGTNDARASSLLDEKDGLYITDREEVIIEQPTEDEKATLRRVADQIPFAAFTIVIVEFCERFAYYGLSGAFQNYIHWSRYGPTYQRNETLTGMLVHSFDINASG